MKKLLTLSILVVLLLIGLLIFDRQQPAPKERAKPTSDHLKTNAEVTTATQATALPSPDNTNAFIRPASIGEEQWGRLMLIRQLALAQNQPVEFYARAVDQNEQPVGGARLRITLSRIDEKMFETTNFLSRKMGDEIIHLSLELTSDMNGWMHLTNITGKALWVEDFAKEGYLSKSYEGGVSYEPSGKRNPISDILMTNAWNPNKGYIFHLQRE